LLGMSRRGELRLVEFQRDSGGRLSGNQGQPRTNGPHLALLSILTAAFLCRVVLQLVQAWWPVDVLASFENWHSAILPYPMLLAWQLAILAIQVWVIVTISRNAHPPRQLVGQVLLVVGGLYFTFMLFRLVAEMSFLQDLPWFQVRLPTIFHLGLAAFLLVLADFHLRYRARGLGQA
jgi:hypothetical protein